MAVKKVTPTKKAPAKKIIPTGKAKKGTVPAGFVPFTKKK